MAKRGYRGKHPNDDMKVAPTSTKAANYAKLTDEYNKTGPKNKYDYIKTHDGFYPQGEGSITFNTTVAVAGGTVTLISADGTSKDYLAAAAADITVDPAVWILTGGTNGNVKRDSFIAAVNAPDIAASQASGSDAIDTTGVNDECTDGSPTDTVFTIKDYDQGAAAFTAACTITLDCSETTAPAGSAANAIGIGISALTDAQIADKLLLALHGDADANIKYATSGVGQSGFLGFSVVEGSSATKIDITIDDAGAAGNAAGVLASSSGEDICDVTATQGGADKVTPGHSGKIVASADGNGKVKLVQTEPGPDGNTAVAKDADAQASAKVDFIGG
jgi:hypothetical protein